MSARGKAVQGSNQRARAVGIPGLQAGEDVNEVYRIGENGDDKPIRLKIEDKLILNKKGETKEVLLLS